MDWILHYLQHIVGPWNHDYLSRRSPPKIIWNCPNSCLSLLSLVHQMSKQYLYYMYVWCIYDVSVNVCIWCGEGQVLLSNPVSTTSLGPITVTNYFPVLLCYHLSLLMSSRPFNYLTTLSTSSYWTLFVHAVESISCILKVRLTLTQHKDRGMLVTFSLCVLFLHSSFSFSFCNVVWWWKPLIFEIIFLFKDISCKISTILEID